MKAKRFWTIVLSGTKQAVLPFDCNPDHESDEGMLVYRSREAAKCSAKHQLELYQVDCVPCKLSEVEN